MIEFAGVVARLEQLADRVTRRSNNGDDGNAEQFHFGARALRIHWFGQDDQGANLGLVTDAGNRPAVDLYVVTPGEVVALDMPADGIRAAYSAMPESLHTDWLVLWEPDTGKLLALHRERKVALWQAGSVPPPRERAEFCRPLLHWLAVLDGNVIVHAAAVSIGGRGILVAGAGNAGKSTLARACLANGWDVLGDNVVELGADGDGAFRIHPVYPTFKVRPRGALPIPASWPQPEWDAEAQKDIYFVGAALGQAFERGSVEHAATLVLDEHSPAEPRPMSRAEAFFRVAPNTVAQFPFFEQEALTRTGMVIGAAPRFSAGRIPVDEIPGVMAGLLAPVGEREVLT